jgi:hypothetical protein
MRFITSPVTAFVAPAPLAASAQPSFPARPLTLQSTVRADFPAGDVVRPMLRPHG